MHNPSTGQTSCMCVSDTCPILFVAVLLYLVTKTQLGWFKFTWGSLKKKSRLGRGFRKKVEDSKKIETFCSGASLGARSVTQWRCVHVSRRSEPSRFRGCMPHVTAGTWRKTRRSSWSGRYTQVRRAQMEKMANDKKISQEKNESEMFVE